MEKDMKKFPSYFGVFVDARGRAGGLELLWDKMVNLTLLSYSLHHMDASIKLEGKDIEWRFTSIYGWVKTHFKAKTGEMMFELKNHLDLPLLI